MGLNEVTISRAIMDRYFQKLQGTLELDVAVVGAGPSGMVAAYYLAKAGHKVTVFERKLSPGGGMWGGGMLMNEIVVQTEARRILEEFGVRSRPYADDCFTADLVETISAITARTVQAGALLLNCWSAEDVVMRPNRVTGLVVNWTPVEMAGLHVDPLSLRSRFVVDATGHHTEVVKVVVRKVPGWLITPNGEIEGEKSMWAEEAEKLTMENTREVFPGLYVTGMAANATFGGPRMGPVFGGMLLSGEKVAHMLIERLRSEPAEE